MPALFTSVSSVPTSGAIRRTSASEARSATSSRSAPISWATVLVFSGSRPCTITDAPAFTSSSATRRPWPSVEPVTRIVCSASGLTGAA